MVLEKQILCVLPQLTGDVHLNPGGQITAANGLVRFLSEHGYMVRNLNTVSPSFPPLPLRKKALQSFKRIYDAFCVLRSGKIAGVIMFTGVGLSFLERLAISSICRLFRVKNVLFFRNSSVIGLMSNRASCFFMRAMLHIPTIVAVQGGRWKESFVQAGVPAERIVTIPNWVPSGLQVAESPKYLRVGRKANFIFVGHAVENKGIKTLIGAIDLLNERKLNFRVTIIGGGTCEEWLRSKVESSGWKNISVMGWKSAADIYRYLEECHVFVLPTYHPEGFPNALLEAMVYGLPAISTDVGAISESLKNEVNGFLVPPKDEFELAGAMQKYIEDPSLITEHSVRTLEIVKERHDPDINCQTLLNALLA